jgi:hypothetical protein
MQCGEDDSSSHLVRGKKRNEICSLELATPDPSSRHSIERHHFGPMMVQSRLRVSLRAQLWESKSGLLRRRKPAPKPSVAGRRVSISRKDANKRLNANARRA